MQKLRSIGLIKMPFNQLTVDHKFVDFATSTTKLTVVYVSCHDNNMCIELGNILL